VNFFQSLLQRVNAFHQREQEKRDAEDAELARVMTENAEYIAGLNTLPYGTGFTRDASREG